MTDPTGLVRAMDAIEGVLAVGIKVERAGAHWIGCAAFDVVRKRPQPPLLTFGRRPSRPLFLAADRGHAGPSLLADDSAVANRLALGKHVVNVARVSIDHDRSRGFLAGEVDDLTAIGGCDVHLLIRRVRQLLPIARREIGVERWTGLHAAGKRKSSQREQDAADDQHRFPPKPKSGSLKSN